MRGVSLRILGFLLLAIPFVPIPAIFGETKGTTAYHPPGEWALGMAIFGVAAYLVASGLENRLLRAASRGGRFLRARHPTFLAVAGAATC